MSWSCGHLCPISGGLETRYHVLEEFPVSTVYFSHYHTFRLARPCYRAALPHLLNLLPCLESRLTKAQGPKPTFAALCLADHSPRDHAGRPRQVPSEAKSRQLGRPCESEVELTPCLLCSYHSSCKRLMQTCPSQRSELEHGYHWRSTRASSARSATQPLNSMWLTVF